MFLPFLMYTLTVYTLTWLMCMFCSISAFYAAYLADILERIFLKLQLLREILLEEIALSSANSIVYYCSSESLLFLKISIMPISALEYISSFSVIVDT